MGGVTIICSRCSKALRADDEYSAELMFDNHVCEGLRDLKEMPLPLLMGVIENTITELEAWEILDEGVWL